MDTSTTIQPEKRPRVALVGKRGAESIFSPLAPQRIYLNVESVSDLSPFRLHREIMAILGGECKISKTKRGVMLELARKSDEEKLTKMKELGGIKVKVARDAYLNTSRGVINHKDLRGGEEEEFVECIPDVINARRIEIKRGGGEDQDEYIRQDLRLPHPTL
ncbi:Gag-like protein [Elysia marginata]|uniref:Gag-like protein n=1 Tax=Elysia marginata TaxID=1093978 RepID=A0AAV4G4B0_9GAST|nr:Gag-like protein [Elysia marginata]